MVKRIAAIVAAGSTAAALLLTLGVPSSSATTTVGTWTVTPGGSFAGAAGTTNVTDVTAGLTLVCTSSSLTGTLKSGSALHGSGIGTITGLNFTNCTADGITASLSSGPVTYKINASRYGSVSGVTHGTITKIHLALSSSLCSAVIDGTSGTADNGKVNFTYSNKTHHLKILTTGSTLHLWDVSGCFNKIANGDAGYVSARYKLTPTQTITRV